MKRQQVYWSHQMVRWSVCEMLCLKLLPQFLSPVNKTLLHMIPMNSSRAGHIFFCEGDATCFWNIHISIKSFVSQTTFIDFKSSKWLKVNLSYLLCQSVDKGYPLDKIIDSFVLFPKHDDPPFTLYVLFPVLPVHCGSYVFHTWPCPV